MVPAGDITENAVTELAGHFSSGDIIVDGGNSYFKDDVRRAKTLAERGIHYLDAGTSGGVWGLERGYCLMVGGDAGAATGWSRSSARWRPGRSGIPPSPGRAGNTSTGGSAEQGYLHCGPAGAGHFVKMVHNGIEYGLMQAYAEGFDILRNANAESLPTDQRYDLDLADIAELWRRGSVVTSWLLDLSADALARNPDLVELQRLRAGFRRGALDGAGRHRRGRARRSAHRSAVRSLPLAPGPHLRREGAVRHAPGFRRPCGTVPIGVFMSPQIDLTTHIDLPAATLPQAEPCVLVIFGASGDLTWRKLMPALFHLACEGCMAGPFRVVGIGR